MYHSSPIIPYTTLKWLLAAFMVAILILGVERWTNAQEPAAPLPIKEHFLPVRTDEALAAPFNPDTHTLTIAELPDGNLMVHVRPKGR
jgi:hypothetical protein